MTIRQADRALFAWVLDLLLVASSLLIASWLRELLPLGPGYEPAAHVSATVYLLIGIIWTVLLMPNQKYAARGLSRASESIRLLALHLSASLLLAAAIYLSFREFSRYVFAYFVLTSFLLLWARRGLWQKLGGRTRQHQPARVLIVGNEADACAVACAVCDRLQTQSPTPIQIVGFVSEDGESYASAPAAGTRWLGTCGQLVHVLDAFAIDEVVIAFPSFTSARLTEIASTLRKLPVRLYLCLDRSRIVLAYPQVPSGPAHLVDLPAAVLETNQWLVKRFLDLALSLVFLIALLPVMCLIAIAIKLDSPGPVLFKQWRIGENGRPFRMIKFRSMIAGAETRQAAINRRTPNGELIHKHRDDPRVTRVGRFLRRWSLDELPELLNVLAGDMSLVGPRPELTWLAELYQPDDYRRLLVPPGLTGLWQIRDRSDRPLHLALSDDLYYVEHYSLWLDLWILLRTPMAILRGRGAF